MYTCLHIKRKNKKKYVVTKCDDYRRELILFIITNKHRLDHALSNEIESFSIDSFHCTAV